ncbi:MAG: sigma factor [Alistipes finegoldii]
MYLCKHGIHSTDNARLTAAIRDGSREAFDEMCGRYYAPLMAYARLFLKGNWAQDIVQDVFVNVWIRRETLDPRQSLTAICCARSTTSRSIT